MSQRSPFTTPRTEERLSPPHGLSSMFASPVFPTEDRFSPSHGLNSMFSSPPFSSSSPTPGPSRTRSPLRNRGGYTLGASPGTPFSPKTPKSVDELPPPPFQSLNSGFSRSPAMDTSFEFQKNVSNILQSDINPGVFSPVFGGTPAGRDSMEPISQRAYMDIVPITERSPLDILQFGSPIKRNRTPSHIPDRRVAFSEPTVSDSGWVTVFGFHRTDLPTVLQYFESIGRVLTSSTASPDGNLLNLQYESVQDAQVALSRHGSEVVPTLMIGVKQTDPADLPARPSAVDRGETGWTFTTEYAVRRGEGEAGEAEVRTFHYNVKDERLKHAELAHQVNQSQLMKIVEYIFCL